MFIKNNLQEPPSPDLVAERAQAIEGEGKTLFVEEEAHGVSEFFSVQRIQDALDVGLQLSSCSGVLSHCSPDGAVLRRGKFLADGKWVECDKDGKWVPFLPRDGLGAPDGAAPGFTFPDGLGAP